MNEPSVPPPLPPPPLPLPRTHVPSGPPEAEDIIDETLGYFKANVLFKHFEVKGCADRVLIYLTLYTTQCLKRLESCPRPAEGLQALTTMAHEDFTLPGAPNRLKQRSGTPLHHSSASSHMVSADRRGRRS